MRKFLLSFTSLIVFTGATCLASAGEPDFSQPFKDLPGVKTPEKPGDSKFKAACEPEIRTREFDDPWYVERLPRQVYTCKNGPLTIESTQEPLEHDWNVYKNRH